MRQQISVDLSYLQDGAYRKYRQLLREIEELPLSSDQKSNVTHTAYKLGAFLGNSLGADVWRLPEE